MLHLDDTPRYLCSELVSILYEDRDRNVHQTTANLEDISSGSAELLLFDNILQPGLAISFCSKDDDLYGVVQSCEQDPTLGWFARIRLDKSSQNHGVSRHHPNGQRADSSPSGAVAFGSKSG